MSEVNVKTNKMVTTTWTYQKEQSFASNYFIFSKFCFSKNLLYRVDLLYQQHKYPYLYFLLALEFYLMELFPCEYPAFL